MRDITNVSSQVPDLLEGDSASHQGDQAGLQPDDTIQVMARKALEKVQIQLCDEAVRHITTAIVMYKPVDRVFCSTGCKPKYWELTYPALAFLLNGGYYKDYASIMGMMGLPAMHHTTWDSLVSWVSIHVEQLAEWSCEQVRADIEKHGDKDQWSASFDGFYLTRGTIQIIHLLLCTCRN